jgi:hypothetical protein
VRVWYIIIIVLCILLSEGVVLLNYRNRQDSLFCSFIINENTEEFTVRQKFLCYISYALLNPVLFF